MKIAGIKAREILDSRGNPTLEVEVTTSQGTLGRAAVPSGASTGKHEALELRDQDEKRYGGRGVLKAIANIDDVIAPSLNGRQLSSQKEVDQILIDLDGTPNKSVLGANATLGVSLAYAKAAAAENKQSLYASLRDAMDSNKSDYKLPTPLVNILNGGAHASGSTTIQEFMIVPLGLNDYVETLRICSDVFRQLGANLSSKGLSTNVGDEGGFVPGISSDTEALDLIVEAVADAGFQPGKEVGLALDIAASEFYADGIYTIADEKLNTLEMVSWITDLCETFPIVSIEDGLAEDDWDGWQQLTQAIGDDLQIVGDDLLVTNRERLSKAINENAANAILIKPNQIGTLTETLETIRTAHKSDWQCIISHRSGETVDTTIAHLAVGTGASQIKAGSLSRSERTEKYNELLRIGEEASMPLAQPFLK